MAALIHFYFQEDPDKINLDRFALLWGRLEFALQFDGKMKKAEIKVIG